MITSTLLQIEIRELNGGDLDSWWRLRLEALETEPAAFASSPEEHRSLAKEIYAERLSHPKPGSFVLGAFEARRLIGNIGFAREQRRKLAHKGLIWGVYLTRDYRGKGIAGQLLEKVIDRIKADALVEQVTLALNPEQEAARRLYYGAGFVPYGREPRALKIGDQYIDEEYLVLFLK